MQLQSMGWTKNQEFKNEICKTRLFFDSLTSGLNNWFVGPAPRRLLRNEGVTVPRNRLKLITESAIFRHAVIKTELDFRKTAHSRNLLRIAFLFFT